MPIRLNGSTSGYSQLDAPAIAGDQLFTLPGAGGTLDRINRAGNVLQVVQASTSTNVNITTTTYTDTGLTASITPTASTNKVLVIVNQLTNVTRSPGIPAGGIRLLRDSTAITAPAGDATGPYELYYDLGSSTTQSFWSRFNITYLDSPSTTASVTYKTQARPYTSANGGVINLQSGGSPVGTSYITLLEIAA